MEREQLEQLYEKILERNGLDLLIHCPNCTKRLLDELCDIYFYRNIREF